MKNNNKSGFLKNALVVVVSAGAISLLSAGLLANNTVDYIVHNSALRRTKELEKQVKAQKEDFAALEEAVARNEISRILDKEGIKYQREANESEFGPVDFLIRTKKGYAAIEYANKVESADKGYQTRMKKNTKLSEGLSNEKLCFYLVKGPLTMQVGSNGDISSTDLLHYQMYDQGIVRMIKERIFLPLMIA